MAEKASVRMLTAEEMEAIRHLVKIQQTLGAHNPMISYFVSMAISEIQDTPLRENAGRIPRTGEH